MDNNQKHTKETFYYSLSRMLERASYYGIRALIFIYMTDEILQISDKDAVHIYSWFGGSLIFSQVIGALLGDFLIGNKKAIIFGGIIQAIGAFTLCVP